MLRNHRLTRIFGFPIELHWSFLLLMGVILLAWGGIGGVFVALLAFASVVAHELGHALVARSLGVHVSDITLGFFGGAARLTQQPRNARDEALIAAAGPAVSFAIGGVTLVLSSLLASEFLQLVAWINLVIGTFNMIPALPMDGGRILRALLSTRYGFYEATKKSIQVSRVFALVFGLFGLFTGRIYFALLAVMLWFMGSSELMVARRFGYRDGDGQGAHPEVEVMPRGFRSSGTAPSPFGSSASPGHQHGSWSTGPMTGGFALRNINGRWQIVRI